MKIEINAGRQQLILRDEKNVPVKTYSVSTSKNGLGEKNGSFCTPRGSHIVRAKIGAGQPVNTVFVRRRPTGEVWSAELHAKYPGRDWMLTRLLWLSGRQVSGSVRSSGNVDSQCVFPVRKSGSVGGNYSDCLHYSRYPVGFYRPSSWDQ